MSIDAATAAEVAAVITIAVLIVAIVAASAGACGAGPAAAVHDVELALGEATLVTYEQARAAFRSSRRASAAPPTEGKENVEEEEEAPSCAICLSEYAGAGELVRVVPACRHFFHAECGVDGWLRKSGTCPLCRGRVTPLPGLPRPECPPLPARARGDAWGSP
jgi:Zn finger protein HypA/HybF involved in hydrogenase expression